MKTMSIKTKVIVVLTTSLALGALALILLLRATYNQNVHILSTTALTSAQRTFENVKAKEFASLGLVTSGMANIDGVRELFMKGDREGLHAYLEPLYKDLKERGINVVTFLDKDAKAFLRMLTPTAFGDSLAKLTTIKTTMQTQQVTAGIDLAKPGLSNGSCRPFRDKDGNLIGYIVAGGSLDHFLETMKRQTSDDYVLMGYKSFLDEKLYRSTRKAKGQPDTWDQFSNVIVLSKTMEPSMDEPYEAELKELPADGRLLGQVAVGGSTYVRGVFPLYDAAGRTIGGIFASHDITGIHRSMQKVQNLSLVMLVLLMLVLSITLAAILHRLIFARLKRTMEVVTRVVGGEFTTKIVPVSHDEVGHLEELFEQFRTIFVGIVDDLSTQQRDEDKTA